jgi:hypothetical protein
MVTSSSNNCKNGNNGSGNNGGNDDDDCNTDSGSRSNGESMVALGWSHGGTIL